MNREELIEYIMKNDRKYSYQGINFNLFNDEELLFLKKSIDEENKVLANDKPFPKKEK